MLDLFKCTVYVRIKPDQISALHVESGNEHRDIPLLAFEQIKGKMTVTSVGSDAATKAGLPNVTLINGFKHPRTLIADFTVAEKTLKYFLKQVIPGSLFAISPIMIIHPQEVLEGGLTQIEIRAFAELGFGAGARKVYLWEGPELSKEELQTLRFSRPGGKLLHPPANG